MKLVFSIICAVFLMACSSGKELVGTWQMMHPSMIVEMKLNADKSYSIDFELNGVDVSGTYSVKGDKVTFKDMSGDVRKNCEQSGAYKYGIQHIMLDLNLDEDPCLARSKLLQAAWKKLK